MKQTESNPSCIGIVPCGGFGTRLRPYNLWKELIPVGYKRMATESDIQVIPKALGEYIIESMTIGGAENVVLVLNEFKGELVNFFRNGRDFNTNLAYSCQSSADRLKGIPVALDSALGWLKGRTVFMGMPDTILNPRDCFKQVLKMHRAKKADLTLGVFPTDTPTRLAPVLFDPDTHRVLEIHDKPVYTEIYNTWNIAAWGDRFTDLVRNHVARERKKIEGTPTAECRELLLSDCFTMAVELGMDVYCCYFEEGLVIDFGNINDLARFKHLVEKNTDIWDTDGEVEMECYQLLQYAAEGGIA